MVINGEGMTRRRAVLLAGGPAVASVASVASVVALAGCGGEAATPASKVTAPVTVTYGNDWSTGPRGDIMKAALTLFAQQFPKITVQKNDMAGGVYPDKIAAQFASGTPDDVLNMNGPQAAYYRDINAFVELSPYLKAAKLDPKIFTYLDPSHANGNKRYYLPFQMGGGAWYVNKTLFQQNGVPLPNESWTWNDWADAGKRLTNPDKNQYGFGSALNNNSQVSYLPIILSNGGHHINETFTKTLLTTPESMEALKWVADRVLKDRSWVPPEGSNAQFNNGNVAMEGTNIANVGNANNGRVATLAGKFEWDLMPMPKSPRTGKRLTTLNQQPNGMPVKQGGAANRVDAAFTLLQFMSGKDVQLLIARDRGSAPAIRELVTSAPYTDAPPASMAIYGKSLESAGDLRIFAQYDEFRLAYGNALMDVWNGKVSPESGIMIANAAADAVLAKVVRK
jgi:multiple sugar transport system substrate-binding protein